MTDERGRAGLTWRELLGYIKRLPRDSAYGWERHGEAAAWTFDTHLLATIVDLLAGANWQRGGDNRKPRPTPLPRP